MTVATVLKAWLPKLCRCRFSLTCSLGRCQIVAEKKISHITEWMKAKFTPCFNCREWLSWDVPLYRFHNKREKSCIWSNLWPILLICVQLWQMISVKVLKEYWGCRLMLVYMRRFSIQPKKAGPARSSVVLDHLGGVMSWTSWSKGKGVDWTKLLFCSGAVCWAGSLCASCTKRGVQKGRTFQQNPWLD